MAKILKEVCEVSDIKNTYILTWHGYKDIN
jgi:hypothetical protein